MTESEGKKFSFYFFKIFQIPEAEVIIFLSQLSSQNRKISVLVLFKILACPIISSFSFEVLINFMSREIVTQGTLPAAR